MAWFGLKKVKPKLGDKEEEADGDHDWCNESDADESNDLNLLSHLPHPQLSMKPLYKLLRGRSVYVAAIHGSRAASYVRKHGRRRHVSELGERLVVDIRVALAFVDKRFASSVADYYSLDITYFKSSLDSHLLDLLWNKYWVNTLSSSPLLGNGDYVAGQISDLAEKLEQAESQLAHSRFGGIPASLHRKKEDEPPLAKITRDSAKITVEQVHGLMSQVIKDILFNSARQSDKTSSDPSDPEPMITS
ncbi:hypothetical protein F2Q69_00027356 [Brassica cretica]|uniref:Cop9 signalosome subunit 5 C-terminal domain-containing protein n=1 Tax=Brassica cretica TaxID=69181 RepID=A0A8S9S2H8_BRACR|nr:hypothetical protein F2Q69_00027356 [Brassica cretica]